MDGMVLKTVGGTSYFSLDDSGNLTITGTLTAADLALTGAFACTTINQDVALTGTGDAINSATTVSHATQSVEGLDLSMTQSVARTGGTVAGLKATLVGHASDTSGATYVGLDLVATPSAGSGVFVGIRQDAGWAALLDSSSAATGENDWIVGANLASALEIRDSVATILTVRTVTNARALQLGMPIASTPDTVQDVATGNTISVPTTGDTKRLTASVGAATGVIMPAGVVDGQRFYAFNVHATNSITFAASGTSRVAAGTSAAIPALGGKIFQWDNTSSLWYALS